MVARSVRGFGVSLVVGALLGGAVAVPACRQAVAPAPRGRVGTLGVARTSPHAAGRDGDLTLEGEGAVLTFARTPHLPGHRPLEGSLLDVSRDGADVSDPLMWWRAGWMGPDGKAHALLAERVEAMATCAEGGAGVLVSGTVEGVRIETRVCPDAAARFTLTSRAEGLPPGAELIDEMNVGTSPVLLESDGNGWEGERPTSFVALGEAGIGLLFELATPATARRNLVHIATETFPALVVLRHGAATAKRTLHLVLGDALDAMARAKAATRVVTVGLEQGASGSVHVRNAAGVELARGSVPASGRELRLPPTFGATLELRDRGGVPFLAPVRLENAAPEKVAPPAAVAQGRLKLTTTDERGAPLPVHVLFHGEGGTPDPSPATAPRAYASGPSVYALDGILDTPLAVGRYRVLVTHGPAYDLGRFEITVGPGEAVVRPLVLARIVDTSAWTGADFHLHAAPSPDAPVSLEERVASLVCEGVDLAVATDHNHISDYGPTVQRLGTKGFVPVRGNEITSAGGTLWGHFIGFPLALPTGANEDAVSAYYETAPKDVFADARRKGARVLQVNHPRMPPRIGYFELAAFDPRTGAAGPAFSDEFDAVEAHNGIWLEAPARVREGVRDLVGLVRRGRRPTATGNSDSHRLLFEEAGWPRTYVHTPRDPEVGREGRVVDGLLRGDTTVSAGPFVETWVEGKPIGSIVRPRAGKIAMRVRVSAPAWVPVEHVEVWVDDWVALTFPVEGGPKNGVRFEKTVDVPISADAVVLAWAEAEQPLPPVIPYPDARAIGFSGLTYVDADGDGKVIPPASVAP